MPLQNLRVSVFAFFTVLGVCVSSAGARAQAPSALPTPTTPFLRATRHEQVEFSRSPKRTLHTWYMESRGAGMVEARVWYIAGGKAILRDQCLLWWDAKSQAGAWRLLLLEQAAPKPILLPSYELNTVFDPEDEPNSATGLANPEARKPVRLPSAFNAISAVNDNKFPGLVPAHPEIFYVAETVKLPDTKGAIDVLRRVNPQPVEDLTKRSRKEPGKAFLILTVQWKPAQK